MAEKVEIGGELIDVRDIDGAIEALIGSVGSRANGYWFGAPDDGMDQSIHEAINVQAQQYLWWLNDARKREVRIMGKGDLLSEVSRVLQKQVSAAPDLSVRSKDNLWTAARTLSKIERRESLRQVTTSLRKIARKHKVESHAAERMIERTRDKIRDRKNQAHADGWTSMLVPTFAVFTGVGGGLVAGGVSGGASGAVGGSAAGPAGLGAGFIAGFASGVVAGHAAIAVSNQVGELATDLSDLARLESDYHSIHRAQVSSDTIDVIVDILEDSIEDLESAPPPPAELEREAKEAEGRIRDALRIDRVRQGRTGPKAAKPTQTSQVAPAKGTRDIRVAKIQRGLIESRSEAVDEGLFEIADVRNDSAARGRSLAEERETDWMDSMNYAAEKIEQGLDMLDDALESIDSAADTLESMWDWA